MSTINGKPAEDWISENSPEIGVFKVYWKDVIEPDNGGASFKDEGEGLRYEWYYKDGKQDGVSKGWFPNGQIKNIRTFKDGDLNGLYTIWYENGNGQKRYEGTFKDGKEDGLYTNWYDNGQKKREATYKDGKENGKWIYWYKNGQKKYETTYKNGNLIK